MTAKSMFLPFMMAVLILSSLAAQDQNLEPDTRTYIINHIEHDGTGLTRSFAVVNAADIREGDILIGLEALDLYIQDKTQLLLNERVLEDARIEYTLLEADEEGRIPVDIIIVTVDSWNIIGVPYFNYDSNSGLELSIKARDYNFLGTMQALRADIGYEINDQELRDKDFSKGSFFIDIDSNTPFSAFGYTWNFDFDHTFEYTYDEPLYYKNTSGISVDVPVDFMTLNVGLFQKTIFNEENSDENKELYGDYFEDTWYSVTESRASLRIPTGFVIDGLGELSYRPRISGDIKYRPFGSIDEPRKGPSINIGHALEAGRTNWIGNYRSGISAFVDNSNGYNFHTQDWSRSVTASVTGHFPICTYFGISSRLTSSCWFDSYHGSAGDKIRGIMNDDVAADYAAYLNLDLPVRVIRFVPSEWLNNRKLRLFDFEQHWSPFLDTALVKDPVNERDFSREDMLFGGGLEVITYPLFMRSLFVRISAGWNLNRAWEIKGLPGGGYRELFFGLGHHY